MSLTEIDVGDFKLNCDRDIHLCDINDRVFTSLFIEPADVYVLK